MVTWSSILDYCHSHRVETRRYALTLLLLASALGTGRSVAAAACFAAIPLLYAYHRWGGPWRQRGEQMIKSKPRP